MTQSKTKEGCRKAKIVSRDWGTKQTGGEAIDFKGKNVYLFQLPVTIPTRCYKNIKLPTLKPGRSRTITITDDSTEQHQEWKLRLNTANIHPDFTLMDIGNGQPRISDVQPSKLIQGVIDVNDEETEFLVEPHSKHVLPEGLRQRFTPYGVTSPESPKRSPRKRHAAERQKSVLTPDIEISPPFKKLKKSKKSKKVKQDQ